MKKWLKFKKLHLKKLLLKKRLKLRANSQKLVLSLKYLLNKKNRPKKAENLHLKNKYSSQKNLLRNKSLLRKKSHLRRKNHL